MRVTAGYKAAAERSRVSEASPSDAVANVSFPAVLDAAANPQDAAPTGNGVALPDVGDGEDPGQSAKRSRGDQNAAPRDVAGGSSAGQATELASDDTDAIAPLAALPPSLAGKGSAQPAVPAPLPQPGEERRHTRLSTNGLETVAGIAGAVVAGPAILIPGAEQPANSLTEDDGPSLGAIAAETLMVPSAGDQTADAADAHHVRDGGSPISPDAIGADSGAAARPASEGNADGLMRAFLKGASFEPEGAAISTLSRPPSAREDPLHPTLGAAPPFVGTPIAVSASNAVPGAAAGDPTGSTTSAISLGELADNLSHHLIRMAGGQAHEVVLRLHPPALGDLTVRILVDGRDVSAWFASPHAQVQQAISAAIGQLHTNLGNAGYNLHGAWVGADARDSGERERYPTARQPQPGVPISPPATEPPGLAPRSASSRVSVYV